MGAILSLSASLTILASRGLWEHPCGEAERDLQAAVPFASASAGTDGRRAQVYATASVG
jgi:hypothetical protein